MIVISFGRWSYAAGFFFVRERVYWRGHWTPFCRIQKRYQSWFGYWQSDGSH